ncbi:MAG: DegV family protein [Dehalococcoidales bacterium]|nr:DegV family protein [Dehalococcoidales bacterium]
MSVRIVTDSTADLSPQLTKELGIAVVPEYLRFGNISYRDGIDINYDEFYDKLVNSPVHPTTSQPTPSDFAQIYQELSKETDEIISIHVSDKLSGTCNSALRGKELVDSKSNITIIDSESVTMGLGIITMSAARLALAGENLTRIVEDVKQGIKNTHLMGTFDTLKYLALGGRIGKARALLGSVLNVKPVVTLREGLIVPVGNVRTRTKAVEKLFEFVKSALNIQELAVVHSTTPDEANSLRDRLSSLVSSNRLHLARLGPALGVHSGPGTLIVVMRNDASKTEQNETLPKSLGRKISVPSLHLPKLNLPHR